MEIPNLGGGEQRWLPPGVGTRVVSMTLIASRLHKNFTDPSLSPSDEVTDFEVSL